MLKVYALIVIVGVLGIVGYSAKYYYDTTQATIATLRENNARLETAVEISEQSIENLKQDIVKFQQLNTRLQQDLQAAEAYGDELQGKLNRMDLVQDALRDPQTLEGKMNGATAKLWRSITEDTGGDGSDPLPVWLQQLPERTGSEGGDQSRENNSANGGATQTSPTN